MSVRPWKMDNKNDLQNILLFNDVACILHMY